MSENNIDTMKYNDLKALCKKRSLNASGTKEVLQARLKEAAGKPATPPTGEGATTGDTKDAKGDKPQGEAPAASETPASTEGEAASTATTPAQEKSLEKSASVQLRRDAQKMKEHLEKQPKVSIMIPFEAGESPENGKKIPFHVNLNGYMKDYPRGQYIEVPQQIADLIKERLESEGKIGAQWRLDRDPKKIEALS